jgi:hypothetical protein
MKQTGERATGKGRPKVFHHGTLTLPDLGIEQDKNAADNGKKGFRTIVRKRSNAATLATRRGR